MAEVTEYRKNHWVGLDADLASVPDPQLADTFLATDKDKLYYKTTGGWKTGLGYESVPRAVTGWDKVIGNFTVDGNWHVDGLDLSGIVPEGAIEIKLLMIARNTAANKSFSLRGNATTKSFNLAVATTPAVNVETSHQHYFIYCDSDRKLDYNIDVGMDIASLVVVGWTI